MPKGKARTKAERADGYMKKCGLGIRQKMVLEEQGQGTAGAAAASQFGRQRAPLRMRAP